MKKLIALFAVASVLALSASAATVSVTITSVHLCCNLCEKDVQMAVSKVPGITVFVEDKTKTITLKASSMAKLQQAANAIVAAGYFGQSSNNGINITANTGAKNIMVHSLKFKGMHLCCAKCIAAVGRALTTVPGVTGCTTAKDYSWFALTGHFLDQDVFDALENAGFSATLVSESL